MNDLLLKSKSASNIDLFFISARTLCPFLHFPDGLESTLTKIFSPNKRINTKACMIISTEMKMQRQTMTWSESGKFDWILFTRCLSRLMKHASTLGPVHCWFWWCYENSEKQKIKLKTWCAFGRKINKSINSINFFSAARIVFVCCCCHDDVLFKYCRTNYAIIEFLQLYIRNKNI